MITMQPVLETGAPDEDFALWPTAAVEPYGFLVLDGRLTPQKVGSAVWRIADANEDAPEDGPAPDPPAAFLYGLLTAEHLLAPGGFRVTDGVTGAVFAPGCCNGLEEWREWLDVADGTAEGWFGHDPHAAAERHGGTVRLMVDTRAGSGQVIELPVDELRRLLAGAEQDLRDFVRLAGCWAERQLPGHARALTAALARALALEPSP
ncbi:hypothetical protein HS99_0007980 [Kitasatospora aureofaciens]|uniref:Uncharacterized protein n=1 Tax=Kitasatospora aureofaciens TaxID=1894 RepID=A0A1E7N536_KITAU|nr:hypothetical protein [Kitasatospora aureofaciens]ARF81009.1 hypothetical protein B6264_20755 [Kitasatospora aureofaciens]OEV35799.1 hypothetical protein HS99_0007980 [Kitasatospora aureofaciens]